MRMIVMFFLKFWDLSRIELLKNRKLGWNLNLGNSGIGTGINYFKDWD